MSENKQTEELSTAMNSVQIDQEKLRLSKLSGDQLGEELYQIQSL